MNDFCSFYFTFKDPRTGRETGLPQADFSLGTPPSGFITAFKGETGEVLWHKRIEAQIQAGTVVTKGGILFAADTLGILHAFNARTGAELHRIDTKGAINSGLISYAVDGTQYVAAEVGGLSLNPPGITRPLRSGSALRVKIFALREKKQPVKVISWERAPMPGNGKYLYDVVCSVRHGGTGQGYAYPTLRRQYHILTDAERLKDFFETVPPPMPKLYPGLLNDGDVKELVAYFKTWKLTPQPGYTQPKSDGADAWPEIYSVLTHPRCINCHTSTDYPRQTDARHPHFYGVVRGASTPNKSMGNIGSAIARCSFCHGDANNAFTGAPGVPLQGKLGWRLAPLSDAWESAPNVAMDGATLCQKIKGYAEHHNLLEHLATPLVQWAFNPGDNLYGQARTKPPLTYPEFIEAVEWWLKDGMPCPQP